jgi:hypothetical protein
LEHRATLDWEVLLDKKVDNKNISLFSEEIRDSKNSGIMQKRILLTSLLLFPTLCFGNGAQENEISDDTDQQDSKEIAYETEDSENTEIVRRDKKQSRSSRKLSKDPQGRNAYLKGNEEYKNYRDQNRSNSGRNAEN